MKCSALKTLISVIALGAMPAIGFAAQEAEKPAEEGINCSCEIRNVDFKSSEEHQAAMLKKYDKDHDGKLSEQERNDAREAALLRVVEKCQEMRDSFDKDKDGKLNADEEKAFDKAMSEKQEKVKAFMDKYDTNKDGMLSADERKHAIETTMAQSLENFLEKFDKDGNGKLDDAESQALMNDIRSSLEERRENFWKRFDTDNDGKLSDKERANAKSAIADAFQKRHAERLAQYDTNKDGKLSADERAAIKPAALFCSCDVGGEKSASAKLPSDKAIDTSATDSSRIDQSDDMAR